MDMPPLSEKASYGYNHHLILLTDPHVNGSALGTQNTRPPSKLKKNVSNKMPLYHGGNCSYEEEEEEGWGLLRGL